MQQNYIRLLEELLICHFCELKMLQWIFCNRGGELCRHKLLFLLTKPLLSQKGNHE